MDLSNYFNTQIDLFIQHINSSLNINVDKSYKIIIGTYRCFGRVRDYNNYNVNKRCKNLIMSDKMLCKRCEKNCRYGMVNEKLVIDNSLYKTYKKKYPQFETEYNNDIKLYHSYNLDDFKEMMRKIEKRISNRNHIMNATMDIEQIYDNLSNYLNNDDINSINVDDMTALHNMVLKQKKDMINKLHLHLTIAENEELYDKIMLYIKKLLSKESINDLINNGSVEVENIIFKDMNMSIDIHMIKMNDKVNPYNLYFKSRSGYLLVGYARNWVDNNDEVPEQHKNYENIVLDDDTQLPVLEVEITDMGSLLTGISKGIYREWEYDDSMEQYRKTSYIERI
jgi:hypothetical protein